MLTDTVHFTQEAGSVYSHGHIDSHDDDDGGAGRSFYSRVALLRMHNAVAKTILESGLFSCGQAEQASAGESVSDRSIIELGDSYRCDSTNVVDGSFCDIGIGDMHVFRSVLMLVEVSRKVPGLLVLGREVSPTTAEVEERRSSTAEGGKKESSKTKAKPVSGEGGAANDEGADGEGGDAQAEVSSDKDFLATAAYEKAAEAGLLPTKPDLRSVISVDRSRRTSALEDLWSNTIVGEGSAGVKFENKDARRRNRQQRQRVLQSRFVACIHPYKTS
jgi:hypothetical protein